ADRFIMNFTEVKLDPKGKQQHATIFAKSEDLIHWTRLDQKYDFHPDPRWYESDGRWDNVWPVARPDGGYYGYFAATPKNDKVGFGLGESADGITWRALEPSLLPNIPMGPPTARNPEVGAVYFWRNQYYALSPM